MFRILKYCFCITCLVTLLSCSLFYNVSGTYFIFLFCWDVLNLETLPTFTPSCYIAELFPILKHCWGILYPVTLLRCSQSWNNADVYPDLLHCWADPNLKTLLMYSVCYYMAELYPILVHCRTMVYLNTLLSVLAQRCRQPIRIEYYVTQEPQNLSTTVQGPMFYGRLEQDDLEQEKIWKNFRKKSHSAKSCRTVPKMSHSISLYIETNYRMLLPILIHWLGSIS